MLSALGAGCVQPAAERLPDEVRPAEIAVASNFMNSCLATSGGDISWCECGYDHLRAEYTVEDLAETDRAIVATGTLPQRWVELASRCNTAADTAIAPRTVPPMTQAPVPTVDAAAIAEEAARLTFGEFSVDSERWSTTEWVLGEAICFEITYTNIGVVDAAVGSYEFSMVTPAGVVANPAYPVGVSPIFPTIVPGGQATGTVCFDTGRERGTFVLTYTPSYGQSREWTAEVL